MKKFKLSKTSILNEFLKEYVDDDSILGAILGGSYATGNYTENSDIDISIITKNNYKKRGNVIIDDIMIEYFINPISELKAEASKFKSQIEETKTSLSVDSKIDLGLNDIMKDNLNTDSSVEPKKVEEEIVENKEPQQSSIQDRRNALKEVFK